MQEGLLGGAVPAEDTRAEKSELPPQHLPAAASPLPGGALWGHWQHLLLHPGQPGPEQRKRAKEMSGKQISEAEDAT